MAEQTEVTEFFEKYSDGITPRERDVLRLRYGMDDGRRRDAQEISELFGVNKKQIEENIKNAKNKFNVPIFPYYDLLTCILITHIPPINCFEYAELKQVIDDTLDQLEDKEREVLRLRFGLNDNKWRTLREIGSIVGVTGERIRQINSKALRKLRHPRHKQLKEYVSKYSQYVITDFDLLKIGKRTKMILEEMKEKLSQALAEFSPRERDIMALRLGLDDNRLRTLEEIGELFGIDANTVSDIEKKSWQEISEKNPKINDEFIKKYMDLLSEERKVQFSMNRKSELSDKDKELLNIDFDKL